MKRGEDERHLPRRGYVGRQTDVRDEVMSASRVTASKPQAAAGIAAIVRSSRVK